MAQAAFFDLDKTILAKSSSFAFARPFYREGLIGRTDVVRSAYAQFVFLASGADHDQMESMRDYMSALVTGWEVEKVKTIVDETLDEIVDPMVYEEAVELIDEHRRAGRDIIIISSSGTEVVEPIGARLGADVAIGTQVAIEDGRYTGEILFYAYGPGKADAMRCVAPTSPSAPRTPTRRQTCRCWKPSAIPSRSILIPHFAPRHSSGTGLFVTSRGPSICRGLLKKSKPLPPAPAWHLGQQL